MTQMLKKSSLFPMRSDQKSSCQVPTESSMRERERERERERGREFCDHLLKQAIGAMINVAMTCL